MTASPTPPDDRLDRIERILQGVTESLALLAQENRETRQLAESNARAIQALTNHTAEARDLAEEEQSVLRVGLNELRQGLDSLRADVRELVQESRENIAQHLVFRGEIQDLRDQINESSA